MPFLGAWYGHALASGCGVDVGVKHSSLDFHGSLALCRRLGMRVLGLGLGVVLGVSFAPSSVAEAR